MKYEYWENDEGTEGGFAPAQSFIDNPSMKLDVDDRPMKRVLVVEAPTWEEAKEELDIWRNNRK